MSLQKLELFGMRVFEKVIGSKGDLWSTGEEKGFYTVEFITVSTLLIKMLGF